MSDKATQGRVWKKIRRDKPLVIGLSPECKLFSALQTLRKHSIPEANMAEAVECIRFCIEVPNYQRKKQRFFYFEHPLAASGWRLPDLMKLKDEDDVIDVVLHMCQFHLQAVDAEGIGLAKKPTRVISNLPSIAESISRQCTGGHRHVHLISGEAKAAAEYTHEFCDAVVDLVKVVLEAMEQLQSLSHCV